MRLGTYRSRTRRDSSTFGDRFKLKNPPRRPNPVDDISKPSPTDTPPIKPPKPDSTKTRNFEQPEQDYVNTQPQRPPNPEVQRPLKPEERPQERVMDSRIERIFSEAIKVEAEGRSPHHSPATKDGLDNKRPTSLAISPAPYYSVLRNSPINRNSPLTPRRSAAAGRSREQQQRLSADEVTPPPPPLNEPINGPVSGPINEPITGVSLPHFGEAELPKPDSPTKPDFLENIPSESSVKSSQAVGEEIRYEVSYEDGVFAPPQSYYPHQAVFLPPAPPSPDDNSTSSSLPPPPLFQDHPSFLPDPPLIPHDPHQDPPFIPPHDPHQDKVSISLESLDIHQDNFLDRRSYSFAPPISPTSSPPPPTTPPQYANNESGESDITIRDEEGIQPSHAEIINRDDSLARNLKLEIVQFSQQQEQQIAGQKKTRRPRRKKDRSRTLSNGFESISRL
eukprot:sb/3464656/